MSGEERLESIRRKIKDVARLAVEENREVFEREKRWREEEEEFWGEESKKLDEKLELAKDIFKWGKDFVRSKDYERLISFDKLIWGSFSHPEIVLIYRGPRGDNCREEKDYSTLTLGKPCRFHYGGYVHSCVRTVAVVRKDLKTPEEFAENLTLEHVKRIHDHVTSGKVYEFIENLVERNSGKDDVQLYSEKIDDLIERGGEFAEIEKWINSIVE